ncbi:MAG: inositol monophosphatase [Nonomuraea sp.]|nr:inositol monophosphatase [Nonomuraea sp.]
MTAGELAEVALLAARAVSGPLNEAFRSRPEIATKRDFHDPVTEHDRAAEATIRAVITEHVPGSVIVGEEGGEHGSGDVRWYVDPIDGTANFAAGVPFFCTSIAAVAGDRLVAGVIRDHVRGEEFVASDAGAFCNGEPLVSKGASADREALLVTGFPSPRDLPDPEALPRFGAIVEAFATVRRVGSAALGLAHVAGGWADVAFGLDTHPWDVAAGILLVERAGGVYRPLAPAGRSWLAPDYVAHVGTFDLAGSVLAP